jgi:hypothetical protein
LRAGYRLFVLLHAFSAISAGAARCGARYHLPGPGDVRSADHGSATRDDLESQTSEFVRQFETKVLALDAEDSRSKSRAFFAGRRRAKKMIRA